MFKIRWGSLRHKIIVWAFAPTALILLAVALISLYAYQRVVENLVIERDRELTRLTANLLSSELFNRADPLSSEFLTVSESSMAVLDRNGKVLLSEPDMSPEWGVDWTRRVPFRQMLSLGRPTFSNMMVSSRQGERAVVLVIPLQDQGGDVVGGVASLFFLESTSNNVIYHSIEELRRGERLYLVDGNSRVLYHTDAQYIGQSFSGQLAVQLVLGGGGGAMRTRNIAGQDIVASFAPVPGTPWGLVVEENWDALIHTSYFYNRIMLLMLALGVLAPMWIVSAGTRRIVRPIVRLIDAARQVANGYFDQRIVASTGDEVEELAGQFNRMAGRLQVLYNDLERQVAERTHELTVLNALAATVSRSLDLREVLSDALDGAMGITDMQAGQAFILEPETQQLVLIAHRGVSEQIAQYTRQLLLTTSTSGLAAIEGRPVSRAVSDYPAGGLKEMLIRSGIKLVVSAPLLARGKMVGAIDLGSMTMRDIAPQELSLLAAIGHQIGVAVENARLYEKAQQLAVMQERNRLARDLHDSVMQSLYGLTMYAEATARLLEAGRSDLAAEHLGEIRDTAQMSLREMRLLIFELRPPAVQRDGLAAALQLRLEAVERRLGMQVEFWADGEFGLPDEVQEQMYWVAQESLNNVLRHAHSDRVSIRLFHQADDVVLEIADDGLGFDPVSPAAGGGFGLRGMAERVARLGGSLIIDSAPGHGTRVRLVMPGQVGENKRSMDG